MSHVAYRGPTLCLVAALVALSPADSAAQPQEISYRNGSVRLVANLHLPKGSGPHPAVVLVQGSGAAPRGTHWATMLADLLVREGFAVLDPDKRGSGDSGGRWEVASVDDLARDAMAAVAALRAHPAVDSARIGLMGLSQGGRIAPIATVMDSRIAFVIAVSSAAVSYAEGAMYEMRNTVRQQGADSATLEVVAALNASLGRFLMGGDWSEYEVIHADALRGPAAAIAKGFPSSPTQPIISFLKSAAERTPMSYWAVLRQPALFVYGEADEADNVPVRESIRRLEFAFNAAGKRNFHFVVVPGGTHTLMEGTGAAHRFSPPFPSVLLEWLRSVTRRSPSS